MATLYHGVGSLVFVCVSGCTLLGYALCSLLASTSSRYLGVSTILKRRFLADFQPNFTLSSLSTSLFVEQLELGLGGFELGIEMVREG